MRAGREAGAYGTTAGSWLDRPEVRLALRYGAQLPGFAWGDILYIDWLHSSFIIVRMPVRQGGQFRGLVMAIVSIGELSNFIAATTPPTGGRAFVLRGHDEVIAHPALIGTVDGLSTDKPLPRLNEIRTIPCWRPCGHRRSTIPTTSSATATWSGASSAPAANALWTPRTPTSSSIAKFESYGPTPWLVGFYVRLDDVNAAAPAPRLRGHRRRRHPRGRRCWSPCCSDAAWGGRSAGWPPPPTPSASSSIENVAPLPRSPFRELDVAAPRLQLDARRPALVPDLRAAPARAAADRPGADRAGIREQRSRDRAVHGHRRLHRRSPAACRRPSWPSSSTAISACSPAASTPSRARSTSISAIP